MRIGKVSLTVAAVITLAATPVVAQVVSAQSVSSRASASAEDENGIAGSAIFIALALAGVIAGAVIAISNDEDAPTSP